MKDRKTDASPETIADLKKEVADFSLMPINFKETPNTT
ncbi:hypothetical protein [Bacillus phage BM-P1]|nr:hypothetical protein [Bacillus phage BM-P1]